MTRIRYSDEFICPQCGMHTALCCLPNEKYKAHCLKCNNYYDVEIARMTNADRIRAMTDEELAEFLKSIVQSMSLPIACILPNTFIESWLDWLRQEVEEEKE